jgi:sulfotransferase family protein
MSPFPRIGGRQHTERPPAPFIVGVPRSGTTLLRLMLDAHSELAIPPETHFLPKVFKAADGEPGARERVLELITTHRRWPDFELDSAAVAERLAGDGPLDPGSAARAFYEAYAAKHGKPRWGEKTPQYVKTMGKIASNLPEARFIHLIRDGRAVALSLMQVTWGPQTIEEAARLWVELIQGARRKAPRLPHYAELRYEDLIGDPEPVVRAACEVAELDFEPAMLDYHGAAGARMSATARDFQPGGGPQVSAEERARQHELVSKPPQAERAERWRDELSADDVATFEAIAGPLLDELGYGRTV